jgi:ABC-type nickel/cobalt efflux system permease component RcnA
MKHIIMIFVALVLCFSTDAKARKKTKHKKSHHGHYNHGRGSSHKGGTYRRANGAPHYRKHK